jgi:anti-anti-sigma factor
MALSVQTLIAGDVFVLLCTGRIVFGDEDAILRERVGNMLPGTPKIVINLKAVEYIDSGGPGVLVGLLSRRETAVANWKRLCILDQHISDFSVRYGHNSRSTRRQSCESGFCQRPSWG